MWFVKSFLEVKVGSVLSGAAVGIETGFLSSVVIYSQ